jgi:tight adherence protein B
VNKPSLLSRLNGLVSHETWASLIGMIYLALIVNLLLVVACLPVVALLMGSGAGADPWAFLLGHPVGLACLAGGTGCGIAGLTWIVALARDGERGR